MQQNIRRGTQLIGSTNKYLLSVFFIICLLPLGNAILFQQTPKFSINLGSNPNSQPLICRIASDQSMIVVGFSNSSIIGYTLDFEFLLQFNATIPDILGIRWIDNVGIMVYGATGLLSLISSNGSLITQNLVGNYSVVQSIAISSSIAGIYVSVFYSQYVHEYNLTSFSFNQIQTYNLIANGTQFLYGRYSLNHEYLFAIPDSGQLVVYSCSTGQIVGIPLSTPDNSSFKSVSSFGNGTYLVVDFLGLLYSFSVNSSGIHSQYLGNLTSNFGGMTICMSTAQIIFFNIATSNTTFVINVYSPSFNQIQTLNYPQGQLLSIDCSANYLITLDQSNNLALNTYVVPPLVPSSSQKFASYLLWLVIGFSIFFFILIIGVLLFCCRRRRRAKRSNQMLKNQFTTDDSNTYEPDYEKSTKDNHRVSELQNMPVSANYRGGPNGNLYNINRSLAD